MKYSIFVTGKAKQDLIEAADYIEYTLLNPKAADDLIDRFEKEINNLAFMPEKHQLANDPVLAAWGIRMIALNNYIVFYTVDKESKSISVIRFLYGKRNWISVLSNDTVTPDWTVGLKLKYEK